MRAAAFILLFAVSWQAAAISPYASLKGQQKAAVDTISEQLRISQSDSYKLYMNNLDAYVGTKVTDGWWYFTTTNSSLDDAKFKESPNRLLRFDFVNSNRMVNLTFVKFPESKQVFVQIVETLPRDAQVVLEKQADLRKSPAYKLDSESGQYSTFAKKGMASQVTLLANSGVGAIQYIDSFVFDLDAPETAPASQPGR